MSKSSNTLDLKSQKIERFCLQDEKVVEESLKVWYGISGAGSKSGQSLLLVFLLFALTTLRNFSTCVTS